MESRYFVNKEETAKKVCEYLLMNVYNFNRLLEEVNNDELYNQIKASSIHWDMDYIMSEAKRYDITPVFMKAHTTHHSIRQTVRTLIMDFLTQNIGTKYTYMEIAHRLVVSDNTVYQTIHRMINEGLPVTCTKIAGKPNQYSLPNNKRVFGEK